MSEDADHADKVYRLDLDKQDVHRVLMALSIRANLLEYEEGDEELAGEYRETGRSIATTVQEAESE